jgi:ADP-heptose:LPS heptosyltransferase
MASLKQKLADKPPKTITVIRTDRVGDLILSTPFLTALRRGFPEAQITAVVDPYCQEVLACSGLVDAVRLASQPSSSDLTVALAPRTDSLKLAYKTGAPLRLGYVYRNRPLVRLAARFLLTHYEEVTIDVPRRVPHEVEQLDLLARRLGLPSTLDLPLTVGVAALKVPGRLVFHLGDRWLAGGWTFDDLQVLLKGLREFGPIKVTAGPREVKLLADNGLEVEGMELCTGLSFQQWAELIGSAEALISPDTGAVHLAAAMGTPVVVAYEASTYEHCSRQWAPWRVPSRSVVKGAARETIPSLLAALEELVSDSRICAS